ncbi:hypothetical protein BGZ51_000186 [Haplosporangium sp. Z 767]|nr:hypothetical protein BGZ51_000186 [Haplosporangium sp. Z 767]
MSSPVNFPSHAHLTSIRQDAQLRRYALYTFGPQGVQDLAVLGAILGNNIREIGRYRVTCDGSMVQGRYTIYELVHFGVLHTTGRRRDNHKRSRRAHRRSSSASSMSMSTITSNTTFNSNNINSSSNGTPIYPVMLANLFPAIVFKAMRKKSVRPPKFQHDESASSSPFVSVFTCEDITPVSPSASTKTQSQEQDQLQQTLSESVADSMLISSEKTLSNLIQTRLHRVKDLPLPRELCFLGAVSLPLPPVLRALHVAWTMDFLAVRATTIRRQHQQQKTAPPSTTALGGLEFRSDVYAYKMRLARLARAKQEQKQGTTRSGQNGDSENMSMAGRGGGPSSTSIPEENEDEETSEDKKEDGGVASGPKATLAVPINNKNSGTKINNNSKSVRKDKRLMQQLLSLESKVPRIVRQWSTAARSCFAEELLQEDRQVQDWVDRQRMQVFLGCGYSPSKSASPSLTSMSMAMSKSRLKPRPALAPIATSLANSLAAAGFHKNQHRHINASPQSTVAPVSSAPQVIPASAPSPSRLSNSLPLSGTRMCFAEGIRLGSPSGTGWGAHNMNKCIGSTNVPTAVTPSRPTSAGLNDRLSASQQMLSMHLWLSLLVSPLSPEHMLQDQFSFLDA